MLTLSRLSAMLIACLLLAIPSTNVFAQSDQQQAAVNPLRLSYISGSVSFWRNGADDWVAARINTPLINGDALYTEKDAALELQGEGRTFIRADDETEMTIVNQTPSFLQLKVTSGRVSLDFRSLPVSGYTVEVDTPNAVFTIDRTGYYRVDVNGDVHFITRRGGRAAMSQSKGIALMILPSEEIVVSQAGRAETYVAPEPDGWDRWNDDRSNELIDAYSDRYITPGIAGARDLDYYGNWRVSDEYGPVWVPDAVSSDWAPYSTGRWVWDPYYQWTWIDDAPWGWAPFHYGRWVYWSGFWAWAPGPVVTVRPVYAPALVAFFGVSSHVFTSLSFSGPGFGWVALGWGEPCVPWWGRSGFVGRPWWGGWGGPRMINNLHVHPRKVININDIRYSNSRIANAVIATPSEHFGRRQVRDNSDRLRVESGNLQHIRGALPVKPDAGNLVADAPRSSRPPEQVTSRPVVSTRRPQESRLPWQPETRVPTVIEQRYVPAPKPAVTEMRRPEPGTQFGPERARPSLPSRYEDWKRQPAPSSVTVQERGAISGAESRPNRSLPMEIISAPQGREPAPSSVTIQERGTISGAETRPNRRLPMEIISAPQGREPVELPVPAVREPDRVMPPQIPEPMRGQREFSSPTPARNPSQGHPSQMRGAESFPQPSRAEPVQREGRPQWGGTELPGIPANRTYRGSGQGNPQQGRPQH